MNSIELNQNTFKNVLAMLNSVDPENNVVALSCIENVEFNENIAYILLLKKMGVKTDNKQWMEHAPTAYKLLKESGADVTGNITFKEALNILVKRKVKPEDIQFYLNQFLDHLSDSIKGLGYDFIDELEITVKLKTKEGEHNAELHTDLKESRS